MKRGFFILICIILFSNILFSQVNSITFGDIELHIGDAKGEVLYLLEQDFVCKKDTDIGNNNWESYEIIDLEENTLGDLYFDNDSLSLISKWNLLDSSDEVYNAFQTLFQLIYKQHISQFIGKGKIRITRNYISQIDIMDRKFEIDFGNYVISVGLGDKRKSKDARVIISELLK